MESITTSKNGILSASEGTVTITINNETKELQLGQTIPAGALVSGSNEFAFVITFDDGTIFNSADTPDDAIIEQVADQQAIDEIAALQALIASGEDPTANLPETAAGTPTANQGDFGYVSVSRDGAETIANTGYDTTGQTATPTAVTQEEVLIENDSPSVVLNDVITVSEDQVAAGNVLDNDSDTDSGLSVVSFEVDGQTYPAGTEIELEDGVLVINPDGSFTFSPNEDWNGQVPVITYTTNTGETATLTIEVTPVDDASVLANDTNTVAEDTVATGNVLDNDSDVDSDLSVSSFEVDGQTYTAGTEVALEGGVLIINEDGSYTFTPNENWNGTVPVITYTTNTGVTATLTIEVTPVDDASVLANDTNTVAEDTVATGNVLDNDSDVDSDLSVSSFEVDGQTYTAGTEVALEGGVLIINEDGSYTFTPNENWNGTVPVITYTTNTGETATLTIEITPVNDAPTIDVVANDFTENSAAAGDVAATYNTFDEDGDALTVDFTAGTNTDGYYALINGEVVLTQAGADLINNGGTLPAIDLTVSDGSLTGQDSDTPVVSPINDAPVSDSYSFSYNENSSDSTVIGTVNAIDPEGTPVTYSIVSGNDDAWFEIDPTTGVISLTPAGVAAVANDFEALANVHNLVVGASDGVNTTNINVTLTELDVNEAPVIDDYSSTINDSIANGTSVYDVNDANTGNDTDIDSDNLTYSFILANGSSSLISENGAFIIDAQTGVISVNDTTQINYDNGSQISLTVKTSDGSLSDTAIVTFDLNNVDANDDLPGSSYSVTTGSNTAWTIPQSNGENLMTISARNADGSMGVLNYEPGNNLLGVAGSPRSSDQITGQIEYNSATGTSESVVIDFNGLVNKAEFSVSNLFSDENNGEQGIWKAYYNGQLVASDTFKTDAGNVGTFNIDTGNIVFDQLVFEATQTINEATNGSVLSDSSDYFLTGITASGPAIMGTYMVSEDGVLSITDTSLGLLNNDSDAQGHTFTLTGVNGATVTDGQIVLLDSGALLTIHSDGTYSYDTNNAFESLTAGELSTDTFTYTVTDQYGATDTATVTINIVGESDPSSTYVSYTGNPNDDTIQGTNNNDVIVSDLQSIKIVDGESYNIAFIVDTSGSVGRTQLDIMKAQLTSVFDTLKASIGGTHSGVVNILLVDFDTGLQASVPVNLADTNALTLLAAALNAMASGGNTNYAAGFDAATRWFNSLSGGENLTYFITDGYPNTNSSSAPAAFANLNAISDIEAIGIGNGINYTTLQNYDSNNTPVTGVNANNLASVILGTETQLLQGDDNVDGAAGNDIIFGDLAQFAGITEQGYLALQSYVADKTGQNIADIDVSEVHDYIREHVNEFNINNQYDGNDILNGAAGNDIIFGQGGNDVIYGGEGNDVLIGGLGNDTLIGGLGNDTFVWSKGDTGTDTIKDFEVNNDSLHISDLLQNEQNGNLESYLEFSFSNGSTTISIDADLNGTVDQLIVLDGVDLSHEYGSNDEGVIINGLLNDGALIVDTATANPAPSPGTTHADLFDQHNGNIIP